MTSSISASRSSTRRTRSRRHLAIPPLQLELAEVLGIELLEVAPELLGLLLLGQLARLALSRLRRHLPLLRLRRGLEQLVVDEDRGLGAQRHRDRERGGRVDR